MDAQSAPLTARVFPLRGPVPVSGIDLRPLVEAPGCDVRRVAVAPGEAHAAGPLRPEACALLLDGSVEFTVDGHAYPLAAGEMLWVRAGAARGFVGGPQGATLLAVHLPAGGAEGGPGPQEPSAEDRAVIAQVTAHHAAMVEELDRRTAALGDPDQGLAGALAALVGYWRGEVLPHAQAEEETIYAVARGVAGGAALVAALVLDHRELRDRSEALAGIAAHVSGGEAVRRRAALEAAAAAALFAAHARKENEVVLPALVAAGRPLSPVLAGMEAAFSRAQLAAG